MAVVWTVVVWVGVDDVDILLVSVMMLMWICVCGCVCACGYVDENMKMCERGCCC